MRLPRGLNSRYLILIFTGWVCVSAPTHAATVILDWNAVTTNADGSAITDLASYTVFQSTNSFQRNSVFISTTQAMADTSIIKTNVTAPTTTLTVTGLAPATRYYFRMTALDSSGNQSAFNLDTGGANVEVSTLTAAAVGCDVNASGGTDVVDVQLEVLQALQVNACTADVNLDGRCDVIDVQRIVIAALGGSCVVGP